MSDLLSGVRVLESAVLLNGDTLGMLLGDLGADVIKVETPPAGDYLRDILGQIEPRHSPAHLQANKNKRSIALDLGNDGGREVLWDLLEGADVFVDGFTAGASDRLGIGYEQQRSRKPDIVYCQYTGFGSVGPYARMPTHGQMMNAGAAAVTLTTADDGFVRPAENRELMWGTSIGGDGTAAGAVHAALRVAAALYRRQVTGEGCFLDVSAADAVVAQGWIGAVYGLNYDRITDHTGLKDPGAEPLTGAKYQYYRTSDERFVLFCCIEPKFWERFCRLVGRDDLIGTQLEQGPVDFARDADELRRELQAVFETRTQREWVDMAIRERVPIGPAHQGVASLRDDPQMAARQIMVEGHHPIAGSFTYVGEPAIVDEQPYAVPRPAPAFGAHTTEILTEIGYDESRIAELFAEGIVAGD
ncbi:MAG: CoA transferase [Acidimicrobiaceae bacterium]|nr:CoA transferase [Acidimicrobiaceae bacterium]MYG98549.1 CoA transferase [Acidimicrobiaceae bacterium]MYH00634.1 CoA transferase [Acidimicrobiaceae bacterium]